MSFTFCEDPQKEVKMNCFSACHMSPAVFCSFHPLPLSGTILNIPLTYAEADVVS